MGRISFLEFKKRVDAHYCGRLIPYEEAFKGMDKKVKVHCNVHNIDFEVNAYSLSVGKSNCPLCFSEHMREVQLQKLGIYEVKVSDLTEEYVLDILKTHSMPEIRKTFKNVYVYLIRRFPKPYDNAGLCSEVFIYMIENNMKTYPVDANGNYLTSSDFKFYVVKDTDEEVSREYVLKCLKDVVKMNSLKNHYPKAYDYLFNVMYPIPDDYNLKTPSVNAYIYMIEHNYKSYPKSPITNQYVRFVNSDLGFFRYSNDKSESPKVLFDEGISENPEDFSDMLCKSILNLYDEDENEIEYKTLSIKREKKFAFEQYRCYLYVDGKEFIIGKSKVKYKCRCGRENIIYLKKFLIKTKLTCPHCHQSFEYGGVSCNSKYHENNNSKQTINDKLCFDDMTEEFKENYKNSHITEDEFYKNLKYFVQVNKHKISDCNINDIIFRYAVPNNNQYRFSTKVSFDNGKTFETLTEIYLRCSVCGKSFRVHINNIRKKGDLSVTKCNHCNFCNYTYEVRKYDETSDLTYQSNLEKLFIDKVKELGYKIENGPEIKYFFRHIDKYRNYFVDFYLPEFKIMIEIKGDNKFYRDDVETGKFNDKCNAARKYAKTNNMEYVVLFEEDIDNFIKNLTLKKKVDIEYPTICPLF